MSPLHRNEKSGTLHGLMRVRSFSQDDAHIYCREDQVKDEVQSVMAFLTHVYDLFGFESFRVELSTRPEKSIGSDELWRRAEAALKDALEASKLPFKLNPGDGAFYGPKIDFHVTDALDRSWQCGTIQLDFNLPERFELEYTGEDNKPHRPVMIHRALLGSFERMIGVLVEHWAGAFPVWLAPEQVRVLPVAEAHARYAQEVRSRLEETGLRASVDASAERLPRRIVDATEAKVPYFVVVGGEEEKARTVAVRRRGQGKGGKPEVLALDEFVARVRGEARSRKLAPAPSESAAST
jgi:threonyl-tRNA synthetase